MSEVIAETTARAEAYNNENIARRGRKFRLYISLDGDVGEVLNAKGPIRREDSGVSVRIDLPQHSHRDPFLEPWQGRRSLRVTITSGALSDNRRVCERIAFLARIADLEVYVCPLSSIPNLPKAARQLDYSRVDDTYVDIRFVGEDKRIRTLFAPRELVSGIAQGFVVGDGLQVEQAESLALDLLAHRELDADIVVVESRSALERRVGNHGIFAPNGLMSSREALTTIETFLRMRNSFILEADASSSLETDAGSFYGAVARGLCPVAISALRYCLNPSHIETANAANYLQGFFARLSDLLTASDELGHLAQIEAHMGGNNTIVDRQFYHLQNSVVLFSGCLDMIAWITAALKAGTMPDRRSISWSAFSVERSRHWMNRLGESPSKAIVDKVRSSDIRQANDVIALRDSYQHRLPLQGGVLSIADNLGLVRTRIGIVDPDLTGVELKYPGCPGSLKFGDTHVLIPHRYQRGMIACLASTVESALSAVDWPDDGWWTQGPPLTQLDRDDGVSTARWLFGPLD